MDTETAVWIAHKVAELTHLVIRFQAQFGQGYKLVDESSEPKDPLQEAIFTKQLEIAALLDNQARQSPIESQAAWWNKQGVMDIIGATRLAQKVNRLITYCAFYESTPSDELAEAILRAESLVAGLLHPDVRRNNLEVLMATSHRN
jgi:hypothetical protein